jgi:phosphoglucosamine mutase
LIAGLQFLSAMVETGQPASALARSFEPVPQVLRNVRYAPDQAPLDSARVQAAIAAADALLEGHGRLLIRKSGTEPLIRVMAEADDAAVMEEAVAQVVAAVEDATRSD